MPQKIAWRVLSRLLSLGVGSPVRRARPALVFYTQPLKIANKKSSARKFFGSGCSTLKSGPTALGDGFGKSGGSVIVETFHYDAILVNAKHGSAVREVFDLAGECCASPSGNLAAISTGELLDQLARQERAWCDAQL